MSAKIGIAALVAYVGTVVLANWVVDRYGVVPVGFGLMAPAAVYVVGAAFTLRDVVQRNLGRLVAVAAILVGAALSALISPQLALASGVAFLFSELADFAVYTRLADRGLIPALVASNVVGIIIDSWLFLWLAFGSLTFFWGQVVGKAWMTVLAVAVVLVVRRRRSLMPENRGYYEKYEVRRKDGRDQPGGDRDDAIYFVLDLAHDPYALDALQAYADAAQEEDALPELVADLRRFGWIK